MDTPMEDNAKRALFTASRQYRHNNSDDFVFGYDQELTIKIVAGLLNGIDRHSDLDLEKTIKNLQELR